MKTIKDYKKVKHLEKYYQFDAEGFLEGKTLVIENVKKDKIDEIPCIKVDLRIVKDENNHVDFEGKPLKKNEGKVFTLRVDYDYRHPDKYEIALEMLKNPRGHYAEIINTELNDHYIYQGTSLILTSGDIEVFEEKHERRPIEKGDRSLLSLNKFKTFDMKRFAESNKLTLFGLHPKGKDDVRLTVDVNGEGYFDMKLPTDNYKELPYQLMRVNHDFNDIVASYEVEYTSALNHNTALLVVLKRITFKPGFISDEPFSISREADGRNVHKVIEKEKEIVSSIERKEPQKTSDAQPEKKDDFSDVFGKYT